MKQYFNKYTPPGYILLYKDKNRNNYSLPNIEVISLSMWLFLPPNKLAVSRFRGVTFNKHRKKWVAQLNIKNKNIYIGSYATEEEAHNALLTKVTKDFSYTYERLGHFLETQELIEIHKNNPDLY
jgi:hypothetical protein